MKSKILLSLLATTAISFSATANAFAECACGSHLHEHIRTISVGGTGKLKSAPDKASVKFAIKNVNKAAEKARLENDEIAKKVLNAVRDLGIPEKKIHLENLSIQEEYQYNGKTNELKGYAAYRTFSVDIEKPDIASKTLSEKISEVVAAVVSNGSNRLENVQFGLIDQSKLINEAQVIAMKNARDKAENILKSVGAELGKVQTVSESSNFDSYPRPYMMAKTMAFDAGNAAESTPESFSEGDLEVSATINASFEVL